MNHKFFPLILSFVFGFIILHAQEKNQRTDEEGFKSINGVELYFKTIGSGTPLVIVHGGPGLDHGYFLPQMAELAKHYKLIFYDQRASGKSRGKVDSTTMAFGNFIEDLEGIRKAFGLGKMNLMAHSWGGLIAMKYAIKYPNRLQSLILVNSVSASSAYRQAAALAALQRTTHQDSLDRMAVMQSAELRNGNPEAIAKLFRISFRATFYNRAFADSLTLLFNPNYFANSRLLQYLGSDAINYDLHQQLSTVQCPTLIIHGDADAMPLEAAQKIQESIKGSRLVVLKHCGHFPYIESPQEFVNVITAFLQQ
ncbi:MAG: alpha/beta fold hydrolase [Ignavibacteriales bacterium]|nr:alpha/beta fold hydrolase [Ignavibacteriales bacterium]